METRPNPFPTRSVFLLAGHTPEGWKDAMYPVYDASLGEMTLLQRLIKQTWDVESEPYVVTSLPKLIEDANLFIRVKSQNTPLCKQILMTRHSWKNRVIILRGDVYYSDWAIMNIFGPHAEPTAFGNNIHTWGLTFTHPYFEDIYNALIEIENENELSVIAKYAHSHANFNFDYIPILDYSFLSASVLQHIECVKEINEDHRMMNPKRKK